MIRGANDAPRAVDIHEIITPQYCRWVVETLDCTLFMLR